MLEDELRGWMHKHEYRLRSLIEQHETLLSEVRRVQAASAPSAVSEMRAERFDAAPTEPERVRSVESAESVVEKSMEWMRSMRSAMDEERRHHSDKTAEAVMKVGELARTVQLSISAYEERFAEIERLARQAMQADLDALTTEMRRENADGLDQSRKAWSDLTTASEDRLKAIEDTYRQQMALQAPVDYWQQNRDGHLKEARRYLKVIWWTAPLVFVGMVTLGWMLLGADREPAWGHAILFFVNAAMLVWGLRVIVRLYLGHLDLATESNERIVMAKSYLALTSQGVSVGPAETAIVFGALFGRLPTASVKDDGVPPSAIEVASGFLKGKD